MKLAGFNFTKISVEKLSGNLKDVKINTNIDISDILELKSEFIKSKEQALGVKFTYSVNYDPDFARAEVGGIVIVITDAKEAKEILKDWKDKKISEDFKLPIFNIILKKSSLKMLQLEDDLNIPIHLPLPAFKKEQKQ